VLLVQEYGTLPWRNTQKSIDNGCNTFEHPRPF